MGKHAHTRANCTHTSTSDVCTHEIKTDNETTDDGIEQVVWMMCEMSNSFGLCVCWTQYTVLERTIRTSFSASVHVSWLNSNSNVHLFARSYVLCSMINFWCNEKR